MAENCGSANIKAAGITSYAVQVNHGWGSHIQSVAELRQRLHQILDAHVSERHFDALKNRRRRNRAGGSGLVRRWRALPVAS